MGGGQQANPAAFATQQRPGANYLGNQGSGVRPGYGYSGANQDLTRQVPTQLQNTVGTSTPLPGATYGTPLSQLLNPSGPNFPAMAFGNSGGGQQQQYIANRQRGMANGTLQTPAYRGIQ